MAEVEQMADDESPEDLKKAYALLFEENRKLRRAADGAAFVLRDRFAAEALPALIAINKEIPNQFMCKEMGVEMFTPEGDAVFYDYAAMCAYKMADAMLKARQS